MSAPEDAHGVREPPLLVAAPGSPSPRTLECWTETARALHSIDAIRVSGTGFNNYYYLYRVPDTSTGMHSYGYAFDSVRSKAT